MSELFREKLAGKASGVKSLVASPGLAATELQVTTNQTFHNMRAWEANLVFTLAGQGARDGSLANHARLFPHRGALGGTFTSQAISPPHAALRWPSRMAGRSRARKRRKAVVSDRRDEGHDVARLVEACGERSSDDEVDAGGARACINNHDRENS